MLYNEIRFRIEKVEKLKKDIFAKKLGILASTGMIVGGVAIAVNTSSTALFSISASAGILSSLGFGYFSISGLNDCDEAENLIDELERQGIDVEQGLQELKKKKRTK